MNEGHVDYDALSDRYADPAATIIPSGPARTGEDAAAAGREFAVAEYGSVEAMQQEIRRGRPRIGAEPARAATTRTVRATLSDREWEAFEQLRAQRGARQAELVREAVHFYLVEHRAAS
ncbi:hypothetical protein AB0O87_02880 [Microbacterium sp. NPDC076768]|uniref:hypothetical protein n=1 Tax=Microbacterium sp. NPDC076768 TaxID=3154858 RepID=UPI00343D4F0E